MSSTVISLTTDFGASDWYVGAMKGVALSINPAIAFVDISHDIPPQDIAHGAFVLGCAYRYFSPDTLHVGVVDPGVGTSRRALLLDTPSGRFIAPDNGLLTYVIADQQGCGAAGSPFGPSHGGFMEPLPTRVPDGCSAYVLNRTEYWRDAVGHTFQGRDIFAPVAAHLARGVPPKQLGDAIDYVVCLNVHPPVSQGSGVEGRIMFVDHFGNLASNIRENQLPRHSLEVEIGGTSIKGLSRTFADGNGLLALIGSHGYLEIAEANGSAAERLSSGVGSAVRVVGSGSGLRH